MEQLTLREAQVRFFEDLALAGCSKATLKTYRSFLRPLNTDASVATLTPEACRRLIGDKLASGAYSTAKTYANVLRSFGGFLVAFYGLSNPMDGVPIPKAKPRPHRFLSRDEIVRLWAACPNDEYRLMLLLLLEGVRASEAVGLRWLDLNGDVAQIRGKGGTYRKIAVSGLLRRFLDAAPKSGDTILGYGYQNLLRKVRRLGRLARVPHVHPHLLRHTFASQALLEGMDSETLKTLGGWSENSDVVRRYIESAREAAALERSREFRLTDRLLDLEG